MSKSPKPAERARAALRLLESALAGAGVPLAVPEPQLATSERSEGLTPFEAAVIADALAIVDADPGKPAARDVRIYLRPGRRYTRVFWIRKTLRDNNGSILHFVENETGQVFAAKSSKKVGRRLSRVVAVDGAAGTPALEYVGVKVPRWVAEGVRVRVKSTALLRKYGIRTRAGFRGEPDNRAWPKEVGTLRRREGNGWWDWSVEFERGRTAVVDEELLASVARVREPAQPKTHELARLAEAPAAKADLRELYRRSENLTPQKVMGLLGMPIAKQTRRDKRSGIQVRKHDRRSVSVEWVDWAGEGEQVRRERFDEAIATLRAAGYGFFLLSGEVGDAALAEARKRGIVLVHRPKGAPREQAAAADGPAHRPTPTRANHPNLELKGLVPGARVSIEGEVYGVRSAAGGSSTWSVAQGRGTGPDVYELKHERTGRVARMRVPGVVDKEGDDASPMAGVIVVTFGAKGSFGDARTVYGPKVERVRSSDRERAVAEPDRPTPPTSPTSRAEVWERDRVVWYRPINAGRDERRVELRRGDTVWMSFGSSNVRKGVWGSVNGISKARREICVDRQWVSLPLVYARDEVEGLSGLKPPPVVREPAGESDFGRLLDGLRTRLLRKLRIVSTDASPHDMRVDRVVSHPGVVVAEGLVKKSKARLTIHTDTDERGRPTKYARLRRGSREYRVDAGRIAPVSAKKASVAADAPAAPKPAPAEPKRRDTDFQRERREKAERKAARLERAAAAQHADARSELEHIPMGQPILVGHHSERRHRKAIERSNRKTRQALATHRAAEEAKSAAKRAGYAISSDDPDAIEALRARLVDLEASRALSKAINAAYRKGGWEAVERVEGVTPAILANAKRTMELAHWLKAPMDVKNLGANIRRVRGRIEELEAAAEREASPAIEGDGFTVTEDPGDNRIRFTFAERPSKDVTAKMKRAGFRWSRRHGAWQRQLNNAGRHAAERMAKELFGVDLTEARRRAEWQERAKVDREKALERSRRSHGGPAVAPEPESTEALRKRAAITSADLATYPADVIKEAEASGLRPERILEMLEQSRREEEEMGRKLRAAARAEEATHAAEKRDAAKAASDLALTRLAEALEPLTVGTRETRTGRSRLSGPLLSSPERTPNIEGVRGALAALLDAAERCPTKAARGRLRKRVSAHLKVARRHAKRVTQKHGAGSRAVREARAVRDLLDDARGQLAKGA